MATNFFHDTQMRDTFEEALEDQRTTDFFNPGKNYEVINSINHDPSKDLPNGLILNTMRIGDKLDCVAICPYSQKIVGGTIVDIK